MCKLVCSIVQCQAKISSKPKHENSQPSQVDPAWAEPCAAPASIEVAVHCNMRTSFLSEREKYYPLLAKKATVI